MAGAVVGVARGVEAWFELEFVGTDGGRRRAGLSECFGVRFEEAQPARSFPSFRRQRNFPGWWWSSTVGRHVGYESWLERDQAMLLDFDPQVAAFASQPFWLHWVRRGGVRRHLPDYFVRRADGVGVVVDVRADDRIEATDAEAFDATAAACAEMGWEFRRVGTLDPVFATNLRWLSRYRHPRCGRREDVAARLLGVFAEPTPLFVGAEQVGDRIMVLPVLYHLLWRHALSVDLHAGLLSASSVVRAARRIL
jgi:hypothetical protein